MKTMKYLQLLILLFITGTWVALAQAPVMQ